VTASAGMLAPAEGGGSFATRLGAAFLRYLPALVVGAAVLGIWQLTTSGGGARVIPSPLEIVGALGKEQAVLLGSARATIYEALGGLVIGSVAGTAVAFVTSRWALTRGILLPLAVGASAVPLIAIAPILNNWFGILDPLSKMMMAALLVFFPITVNVTRGLVQVQPAALELMRSYASSDVGILFKVRVPNMLPFLFTALKVSTALAFIGAIVAEFYGGTSNVLGRIVLTRISSGAYDVAWAAILLGAAGAIASYVAVSVAERLVIPWYAAFRGDER
jgi:NitT/TauT family transport system permease protein